MKKTALFLSLILSITLILSACTDVSQNQNQGDNNIGSNVSGENTNQENTLPDENPSHTPDSDEKTEDSEQNPESNENNPSEDPENNENNPSEDPENNENNPSEDPEETLPEYGSTVGYRFRDLTLTTLAGGQINTADLRGKIVIFNIWATWCPPCMRELPDFNIVADEYADDVVIIAAHLYDSASSGMSSYVAENMPDTKIIFAYDNYKNEGYWAAGGEGSVPQTAILDRNGVIVYENAGALSYNQLVSLIESAK